MAHEDEYHDNMVVLLELIWGRGYMAPGGPGNVAKMLEGIDTAGKHILDIGCGIGGPAMEMVRTHGASVTGIDLEAPLVERANRSAAAAGIADRCRFQVVEPGPLPFGDQSFDIVTSAGAFTQTPGKAQIFGEAFRVLKPGGVLSLYEWHADGANLSDDMQYWIELEGLTYVLETLEQFVPHFEAAGFVDIETLDGTAWYRAEARREYELIRGDLYERMVELLGREDADHFVENWRAMVVVIDKGEMRQGYSRGRRPVPG
jgi:phosphoethanolamine N-methyltransferase